MYRMYGMPILQEQKSVKSHFRSFFDLCKSLVVGPNNVGKSTICEVLGLVFGDCTKIQHLNALRRKVENDG